MAGDWIKFQITTSDKPEVWAMADQLGIDPDAVVGKLLRVWAWFDQQTEKGNAPSVTKKLLDRTVGVPSFCDAMVEVGWMKESDNTVAIAEFERHNGKSGKSRALSARRQKKHKQKSNAEGDAKGNAPSVTSELPKEEKNTDTSYQGAAPPDPVDNCPQPPDPVKQLFDTGVAILTAAGVPEQKARQVVGQLRKSQGDGRALEAIQRAKDKTDPVAYLRKIHAGGGADAAWRECHEWMRLGNPKDFQWKDEKAERVAKRFAGEMHAQDTRTCEQIFKREYAAC